MAAKHELTSGLAVGQQQAIVPRFDTQSPVLEHLQTVVQLEVQKRVAEHVAQQEKRMSSLAKAPLLHIARDILKFTLAVVVRPTQTVDELSDVWTHLLVQDTVFAEHLNKMCSRNRCPVGAQHLADEFNQMRADRNSTYASVLSFGSTAMQQPIRVTEAVHASTWNSLIEQAEEFVESSCATPELQQQYRLAYWIVSHAKQFKQVYDSCLVGT